MNLETIFNYRPTPSNAYSTAFDGVDKFECILYVLPNSIDIYKNASVWRDFYYTYAIDAEDTQVASYTGTFTTTGEIATGIDAQQSDLAPRKFIRNNQVLILRGGKTYTLQGVEVR